MAEVNAFIFNMNLQDPDNRLHSFLQICRAEQSLLITKKHASTTAVQAMTEENQQKRYNFWNYPYPFGCVDIDANDIIDIDEAGVYPNETNRKYGKGVQGCQVRETGRYIREAKLNILLAISGEQAKVQDKDGMNNGRKEVQQTNVSINSLSV